MHSTYLRNTHIHGAILGAAIGESLGLSRHGLSRRTALKMFGRPPLAYNFFPGRGVYAEQTRLMLLNGQALLNCRSDLRSFRRAFTSRLSWYLLSLPVDSTRPVMRASLRAWLMRLRVKPGVSSTQSSAGARAVLSALAIHGTGHRLAKWTQDSTMLTHDHPLAIDGCRVLAFLANQGCTNKVGELDVHQALNVAIENSQETEISQRLKQLEKFLSDGRSPSSVVRHFKWDLGVDDHMVPTTVMSTYCWLRYPDNFGRATCSAIALGGNTTGLGAIVGGLVGAHIGREAMPDKLIAQLGGSPHGPDWIEALAERFSHWPHGHDDLHMAPAQTSDPLMQITRNVMTMPTYAWRYLARRHHLWLTRKKPTRMRRTRAAR